MSKNKFIFIKGWLALQPWIPCTANTFRSPEMHQTNDVIALHRIAIELEISFSISL